MARYNKPDVKQIAKQVESRSSRKKNPQKPENTTTVPTASTTFNCAACDDPFGGISLGRMINLIGDSSSGKTFFAKSVFAEAARLPFFDNYRFIMDDVENADDFNNKYLFGKKTAARIEPAHMEDGEVVPSDTIEDFHMNFLDALEDGRPFIYILDSADALDAKQDQEKIEGMRVARAKGNKVAGSYGMAKPKKWSEILRNICGKLKRTNSVLIIISQTRDNIDPMSFEKKTRSGGRALKFYAHHEIWLAMAGKIKKKDRVIGNLVKAKISKNKITGKVREVEFPIFYDYGVDNIRSCVEFLVKEEWWKKNKMTIDASDLGLSGTVDSLIKQIEDQSLEDDLRRVVGECWNDIEEQLKLNRKRKYE